MSNKIMDILIGIICVPAGYWAFRVFWDILKDAKKGAEQ